MRLLFIYQASILAIASFMARGEDSGDAQLAIEHIMMELRIHKHNSDCQIPRVEWREHSHGHISHLLTADNERTLVIGSLSLSEHHRKCLIEHGYITAMRKSYKKAASLYDKEDNKGMIIVIQSSLSWCYEKAMAKHSVKTVSAVFQKYEEG